MPRSYELTTEFFAIPHDGESTLLYSPLKQVLMLANEAMVDLVASLQDGTFEGPTGANLDALQLLIECGAVNGAPDEAPRHEQEKEWKPTEVTLFLTNACNLRCTYCYASAGEFKGALPPATALAAVDLVCRNALEKRQSGFRVSYHGGGEPTLAWEALTASALRAEELARQHGLEVSLNLATNGVLPAWKVDWLVRHIHEFSLSWDGPGICQDRHRPTADGGGSSATVEATLRHLESHGARYGVRLTISRETVGRLDEIVAYLLERFSPGSVHLEPLFSHGRARSNGLEAPDAQAFIDNFRRAQEIASRHGLDLYYSGARPELVTDTFCGVPDGSFNVTPEGLVTSCFEVCHPGDEHADQFFYGRFQGGAPAGNGAGSVPPGSLPIFPAAPRPASAFAVTAPRLARMADFTVRRRPECQHCFCKWHCAGDCIAKNLVADAHPGERLKAARCRINQELTRDALVRRLRERSRIASQALAQAESPG